MTLRWGLLALILPFGSAWAAKNSAWDIGIAAGANYFQPTLGGVQLSGTSTSATPTLVANLYAERASKNGFLLDLGLFYESRKYTVSPAEVVQSYTGLGGTAQIGWELWRFSLKGGIYSVYLLSKLKTAGTAKADTTYLPNEDRYATMDYGYIGSLKFYLLRFKDVTVPLEFRYLYGNKDLITSPKLTSFTIAYQALLGLQFPY